MHLENDGEKGDYKQCISRMTMRKAITIQQDSKVGDKRDKYDETMQVDSSSSWAPVFLNLKCGGLRWSQNQKNLFPHAYIL